MSNAASLYYSNDEIAEIVSGAWFYMHGMDLGPTEPQWAKDSPSTRLAGVGYLFIAPGSYIVDNGDGGPDVGPFQASVPFRVASFLGLTDSSNEIALASDLKISWTGADPNGYVVLSADLGEDLNVISRFVCTERTDKGSFTMPAYILQSLARGIGTSRVALSVAAATPAVTFAARGLDRGQVTFSAVDTQYFDFK